MNEWLAELRKEQAKKDGMNESNGICVTFITQNIFGFLD